MSYVTQAQSFQFSGNETQPCISAVPTFSK